MRPKKYAIPKCDIYGGHDQKELTKGRSYKILNRFGTSPFRRDVVVCNDLGHELNYWEAEFELLTEVEYQDYIDELLLKTEF